MKKFLTVSIFLILMSLNSVIASESVDKLFKNKNTIDCSAKAVIKYVPIKGIDNRSLMYAVLINHKEKNYQLISDENNNVKCIFN